MPGLDRRLQPRVPSVSMRAPTMVMALSTVGALAACSTPQSLGERAGGLVGASLDRYQEVRAAQDEDEERQSNNVTLTAGSSRPPPRAPAVPPRPPGRINPRD